MKPAVFILEDLPDTQTWLTDIVCQVLPDAVITYATNIKSARQLLLSQTWQFMLIDLGLPDGSGISILQEARLKIPHIPAIVTTIYDDDDNLFQAMSSGAAGYLLKSQVAEVLVHQLHLQQQGQPPMSPTIARRLMLYFQEQAAPHSHSEEECLNSREKEILTLLGQGLRTKEVAQYLGLTEYTITTYIRNLYEKLNINSRAQAAKNSIKLGLPPLFQDS